MAANGGLREPAGRPFGRGAFQAVAHHAGPFPVASESGRGANWRQLVPTFPRRAIFFGDKC